MFATEIAVAHPHPRGMAGKTHYLREWRERLQLNGDELGERVNSNKYAISRLERGRTRLTYEWREKLAKALGITPDELLKPPPGENPNDSLTNISDSERPQPSHQKEGDVRTLVGRIVDRLVRDYGAEVIVEEALDAAKRHESHAGQSPRPIHRRRTS